MNKKLTVGLLGLALAAAIVWADNPPVITSQPEDQTVKEGDSVTFSVVAKENSPLNYNDFTVPISSTVNLDMIYIEPGTFMMGSPEDELGRYNDETLHQVTLTRGYWMGKYEVTQAQYEAVMGVNPSCYPGADRPVEQMNWNGAMVFCEKLTALEKAAGRLPGGYKYTLPTEAQWEYACRAGTTTALNSGKNITSTKSPCPNVDEVAWYVDNNIWDPYDFYKAHPVGQKLPNAWGLYDMHGNVWELCLDKAGMLTKDYPSTPVTDPTGPSTGNYRMMRGGSCHGYAQTQRSAVRDCTWTNIGTETEGFRVALVFADDSLSYQWYKNGIIISDAIGSSYTIENAKADDAGRYSVQVCNLVGCVLSNEAVLTVGDEKPSISFEVKDGQLVLNFTGTLHESDDAVNWKIVEGAKTPFTVNATHGKKFYRCAQ